MHILGAIVAGGTARRFGSDKALAVLNGRALIDHAADALTPHVSHVVMCGRLHGRLVSLTDRPAPGLGPLGALNAALAHAQARGFDGVLTIGCDMPLFPAALAQQLIGDGPAIVAGQHLMGWWPATLAATIDAYVTAALNPHADRSMRGWVAHVGARIVDHGDAVLPNINTPADLAALAAIWPIGTGH
jgi:molybdenum cofactor guanylyltransferase